MHRELLRGGERQQASRDEPEASAVENSTTLADVHRLSEQSKEQARLPKMPEDVDELSTTPRKTSTMV